MWPIVAILGIPLVEIAGFVLVGGRIGLWPTLALVVLAGVAGAAVIRAQGVAAVAQMRRALDRGEDPAEALLDRTLVLLAGVLLVVPGFVTDLLAIALLVPSVRRRATGRLRDGLHVARHGGHAAPDPTIIEGTWHEVPDAGNGGAQSRRTGGSEPSGWTRH